MKHILTILFMLILSSAKGQWYYKRHLNDIKERFPNGEIEWVAKDNLYVYDYKDEQGQDFWMFFLDANLICKVTAIHPLTASSTQAWIRTLNRDWVSVSDRKWVYYRQDGDILQAYIKSMDDRSGVIIYIHKNE